MTKRNKVTQREKNVLSAVLDAFLNDKLPLRAVSPTTRARFNVGQTVLHSGAGMYRRGTVATIAEVYKQGEFWYYVDTTGHTHRDRDLI